jgi:hypothetical protein
MQIERLSNVEDKTERLRAVNMACRFKKPKMKLVIWEDWYWKAVVDEEAYLADGYDRLREQDEHYPNTSLSFRRSHDGEEATE